LVEFRQFRPVDFHTGESGEPRFAALLLAGFDEPVVADLGPVSEMRQPTVEPHGRGGRQRCTKAVRSVRG